MKGINWRKSGRALLAWEGVLTVAGTVMVAAILVFLRNSLPPQIPLFYSLPWGEDQLSDPLGMLWAVLLIWIVWILGWIVVRTEKEPILGTFVAGAGLVSQCIVILGLIRVILIIS